MIVLRDAIEEYLAIRRALGSQIPSAANQLHRFATFLECEGVDFVTTQLALRWAQQSVHAQPAAWAERLGVVRRFAAWRSLTDQGWRQPGTNRTMPCSPSSKACDHADSRDPAEQSAARSAAERMPDAA